MLLYLVWRLQPLMSRAADVGEVHRVAGSARWIPPLPAWVRSLDRVCNR